MRDLNVARESIDKLSDDLILINDNYYRRLERNEEVDEDLDHVRFDGEIWVEEAA